MDIRQKISILFWIVVTAVVISGCSNDDKDEPAIYDPAGAIEGTYIGIADVTNGKSLEIFENATFVIRKESTGGVRYDIVREDGKRLLSNIYTTVGYSKDSSGYILAAIDEEGTISNSGQLYYSGKCSVNGVKGYNFTFKGYKQK